MTWTPLWVPTAVIVAGVVTLEVWVRYWGPSNDPPDNTSGVASLQQSTGREHTMRDMLIASVRTGVQTIVTVAVAWLAGFDVFVNADALTVVLTGVAVSIVTLVLRWVEANAPPWLTAILSLGTTNTGPTYGSNTAT